MSNPTGLFALPLELREAIYFHAIMSELLHRDARFQEDDLQNSMHTSEFDIRMQSFMQSFGLGEEALLPQPPKKAPILYGLPALLSVSRQVRAEAEKLLYSRCTLVWRFHEDIGVPENLKHIPSRNLPFIHSVEYYQSVHGEPIDTSDVLRKAIAALVELLPSLCKFTLNLHFLESTFTSSSDPEEVAKKFAQRLGPCFARIARVDLNMWDDGLYGGECGGFPQPSLWKITEHLSGRLQNTDIWLYGSALDHEWAEKIHDLDNPIILMGMEHPARAREAKAEGSTVERYR